MTSDGCGCPPTGGAGRVHRLRQRPVYGARPRVLRLAHAKRLVRDELELRRRSGYVSPHGSFWPKTAGPALRRRYASTRTASACARSRSPRASPRRRSTRSRKALPAARGAAILSAPRASIPSTCPATTPSSSPTPTGSSSKYARPHPERVRRMSAIDFDAHAEAHRPRRLHDRRGRDRARAPLATLARRARAARARRYEVVPSKNSFEGPRAPSASTTCSCTASSSSGSRPRERAADRRARARSGLPRVVALVDLASAPARRAQPIHADDQLIPLAEAARADRLQHRCGRSPTSPRRTARRASSPARTCATSPVYGEQLRQHPGRDAAAAACSCGTAACGTAAAPTARDARRVGIAMNYCAGFIRQQENQQLGIPREIARGFSPRLRELVGYGVYNGLIGHIDKQGPERASRRARAIRRRDLGQKYSGKETP